MKNVAFNRRQWLKQGALFTAGLAALPEVLAAPRLVLLAPESPYGLNEMTDHLRVPGIKLNANENPYGISPKARQAIMESLTDGNRYGFSKSDGEQLRAKIAEKDGVAKESVLLTAGSSEVLGMVGTYLAFSGKDRGNVVFPWPTFSLMADHFEKLGTAVVKVPLTPDKLHDLPAMLAKVNRKTKMVYICNPNNPTGTLLAPATLKAFCQQVAKDVHVMVDEAYIDFLNPPDNESMASLVATYPKLIISRTFSKIYAMAGLRVGYALAHPDTVKALEPFRHGGGLVISNTSLAAALASIQDTDFARMSKDKNAEARAYTQAELTKMGLKVVPSHGNFLYFDLAKYPSDFIKDMAQRGLMVRQWDDYGTKWGRVSIGTLPEMQAFATAMKQVMPS
ncbi:MAG: histidinol-phosphate aminotransferase family protein [Bernardetiaceae bacterium]|jgi:histidinol-phosphate aminotransferase|nr:histidinol-phosphate aminotransferase family protein [Bernardetiaceae bacterium]